MSEVRVPGPRCRRGREAELRLGTRVLARSRANMHECAHGEYVSGRAADLALASLLPLQPLQAAASSVWTGRCG